MAEDMCASVPGIRLSLFLVILTVLTLMLSDQVESNVPEPLVHTSLAAVQSPVLGIMVGVTILSVAAALLTVRWSVRRVRQLEDRASALAAGQQEALRESETRFHAAIESVPFDFWFIDKDGVCTVQNSSFIRHWGHQLGKRVQDMDVPASIQAIWLSNNSRALSGEVVEGEERYSMGGQTRTYHSVVAPIRQGGRVTGAVGVNIDITDRVRVEEALRESEEKFRRLAENANAIIVIVQGRKFIYVNPYLVRMSGYTREELLSMDIGTLIHPDEREKVMDRALRRQLGESVPSQYEMKILTKGGEERWLEFAAVRIEYGGQPAIIGIATDATDRKQAEQKLCKAKDELEVRVQERTAELQRMNAELEQFAYVSSHDLQEPLRMVASYVGLLEHKYRDQLDEEAKECIWYAVDGARRMQRLIKDLLDFSRVSMWGKPFAPVDCEKALSRAMENLRVIMEETGAQVTHDPLPTVPGDSFQLTQVFQYLIDNGLKFRRDGVEPKVHVSAARTDGEWIFSVRDNGIGIESQYYDRIFVIFQRLHGRRQYLGTGIGLAVAKRIVERHGGKIRVESKVGEGTVFHFTIPARDEIMEAAGQSCELTTSK